MSCLNVYCAGHSCFLWTPGLRPIRSIEPVLKAGKTVYASLAIVRIAAGSPFFQIHQNLVKKTTNSNAICKFVMLYPEPRHLERDTLRAAADTSGVSAMFRRLKTITLLLNGKAILVASMAVMSTYLCARWNISANFPLTLIATAIVFPIVFSINSAYKRRESALDDYASLKSHGRAIFFATRDWLEECDPEKLERCRGLLGTLLRSTREMFSAPRSLMHGHEETVYGHFSELSRFIRHDLRQAGLASGEVSRCNQYLSKMVLAFEQVKHVYQYRTPRTLRAFSDFFITVLPPLYGPYFVYVAKDYSSGLIYVMPILFAVILVSLDNIQSHLENPFDQIGQDDVTINAEKFADRLRGIPQSTGSGVRTASAVARV